MLTLVVKLTLKEGRAEEFIALTRNLVEKSQLEEGCIEYNLYQSSEDINVVCFVEKWKSREALALHEKEEHFQAVVPKLGEFLAKAPEKMVLNLV